MERFIVLHTVIMQRYQHITTYHAIWRRIEKRMDAWEAGRHGMLVEKTLWTCEQYHTASRREESDNNKFKTYHSLVLQGKLHTVERWITEL